VCIASYQSAEAKYYEWLTSNDARVRDSHRERNHRIYTHAELLADPEWHSYNCIIPGTKVEGRIVAGLKSLYSGSVVRIVTVRGNHLTVTPNHPVFSDGRWRSACNLRKGDRLLSHKRNLEGPSLPMRVDWPPNEQYAPTMIEDVFRSLPRHGAVEHRATDFHGDGESIKGNIEVACTAGFLPRDRVALTPDGSMELNLKGPFAFIGGELKALSRRSYSGSVILSSVDHLGGDPSLGTLSLDEPPIFLDERPLDFFGIGSASRLDTRINQAAKDSRSTDSVFESQLLRTCAQTIFSDDIVSVEHDTYTGHVYDLQSVMGWIIAGNVLVGNCRCGFAPLWNLTAEQEERRLCL
jgi:hypothetical protein